MSKRLKEALQYSSLDQFMRTRNERLNRQQPQSQGMLTVGTPALGKKIMHTHAKRIGTDSFGEPIFTITQQALPANLIAPGRYDVINAKIGEKRPEAMASGEGYKGSLRRVTQYKKGGKVKKTEIAMLHKGEVVIPSNRVAEVDKALKRSGLKPLKK